MARKTNSTPKGYHTATPVLVVRNAAAAIDYYVSVFGAKELSRTLASDGATILRAALKIGNSVIHVNDEIPAYNILSPLSLGGTSNAVQLYLSNVDEVWATAVAAEITVLLPLEDTYWGERTGKVIDPFGHVWVLSRQMEVVSKREITKRFKALFGVNEAKEIIAQVDSDPTKTVDIETTETLNVPVVDIKKAIDAEAEIPTTH